jgi:sporulation protein YlmC with PRC-barrel domain
MAEVTLVIGESAACSDGFDGRLMAVVIDPAARTVTHLVVEPRGRAGLARLVPLDLTDASGGEVRLHCTAAEFRHLAPAEEILAEFVPGYTVPVQLLPPGWLGAGGPILDGSTAGPLRTPSQAVTDVFPPGDVEERRGDHVHATDGAIGRVHAVRVDSGSRRITHVVIGEGHLRGRKDVAIPARQITGFEDGIRLSITRQQVRELPPVAAAMRDAV